MRLLFQFIAFLFISFILYVGISVLIAYIYDDNFELSLHFELGKVGILLFLWALFVIVPWLFKRSKINKYSEGVIKAPFSKKQKKLKKMGVAGEAQLKKYFALRIAWTPLRQPSLLAKDQKKMDTNANLAKKIKLINEQQIKLMPSLSHYIFAIYALMLSLILFLAVIYSTEKGRVWMFLIAIGLIVVAWYILQFSTRLSYHFDKSKNSLEIYDKAPFSSKVLEKKKIVSLDAIVALQVICTRRTSSPLSGSAPSTSGHWFFISSIPTTWELNLITKDAKRYNVLLEHGDVFMRKVNFFKVVRHLKQFLDVPVWEENRNPEGIAIRDTHHVVSRVGGLLGGLFGK